MKQNLFRSIGLLAIISSYATLASAAVIELLPGQNQPTYTSITALTVGTMNTNYVGGYRSSQQVSHQTFTDREASITLSHNDTIAEIPYILVSSVGYKTADFHQKDVNYWESNSGIYDVRLAAGFWPWIDRVNKHHLGLAVVSTLPTGSYNDQKMINIGENRYRLSGVVNFKYQFSPQWYSESFLLYNWLSDNTHYKASPSYTGVLSQDPSMSLTTYLAYQSPQYWQAYIGLEQMMGTDQHLDGQAYSKGQKDIKAYVGATIPLDAHNLVHFRYGQTIAMETGYREDNQLILKLSHLW